MARRLRCPTCDARLPAAEPGTRIRCRDCDTAVRVPADPDPDERPAPKGRTRRRPEPPPPTPGSDDELVALGLDGNPCPSCRRIMARGAVVCVECGFNRKTGKKLRMTVRAVQHQLDPALPVAARAILATVLVLPCVASGLVGLVAPVESGNRAGALAFAGLWSLVWLTMLGSFTRMRAVKDAAGRPTLYVSTWLWFVPVRTQALDLRSYECLYYGYRKGVSDTGKVVFLIITLCLLSTGICPGLIFWWYVFYYETFTLQLGAPGQEQRLSICKGRETRMRAFADRLKEVAGHLSHARA